MLMLVDICKLQKHVYKHNYIQLRKHKESDSLSQQFAFMLEEDSTDANQVEKGLDSRVFQNAQKSKNLRERLAKYVVIHN